MDGKTQYPGTALFFQYLIDQLVIIERFIREAEEVNDFAPGGAEYKKIAARFKKMQMELKPLPKSRRRRKKERKALRQKEEKERKKKKKEDFTEEEEDSSWFKNAAYRRGGRKTRKTRRRKRRKGRKRRKTRRKTRK